MFSLDLNPQAIERMIGNQALKLFEMIHKHADMLEINDKLNKQNLELVAEIDDLKKKLSEQDGQLTVQSHMITRLKKALEGTDEADVADHNNGELKIAEVK